MSNETESTVSALNQQLAARLRELRRQAGWSLEALAQSSGVSRSMVSQIERGASSPTAVVLARLASAFGLPLAALFDAPATSTPDPVARAGEQATWRDPATGYRRRNVSPPDPTLVARLVDVELPPGARVLYDNTPGGPVVQQQVWLLAGSLDLRWGDAHWTLAPGDCAAMTLDRPTGFHNPGPEPARYAVVLCGGAAR
jgi:transcriptional regulator with XRE-family HTH domain